MTAVDTTTGASVVETAAAQGFGVGSGVVSGPLVSVNIVDRGSGVVGVVGVADSGADSEELLGVLGVAAGVELGGVVEPAGPVASQEELAARFSVPVEATVFVDGSGSGRVVFLAGTDRRTPNTPPAAAGDPYAGTAAGAVNSAGGGGGLEKLFNVGLEVSVELGRTKVTLADVLDYDVGTAIELDRSVGAPVDIRVNDTLLAQGEVVLVDDEYAVRITAIFDPTKPRPT